VTNPTNSINPLQPVIRIFLLFLIHVSGYSQVDSVNVLKQKLTGISAADSAVILNNISKVYLSQKKNDSAGKYAVLAKNAAEDNKNAKQIADAYYNLAQIYIADGTYKAGKSWLMRSFEVAQKAGLAENVILTATALADLNALQGNYHAAYDFTKIQQNWKDSVKTERSPRYVPVNTKIETSPTVVKAVSSLSANQWTLLFMVLGVVMLAMIIYLLKNRKVLQFNQHQAKTGSKEMALRLMDERNEWERLLADEQEKGRLAISSLQKEKDEAEELFKAQRLVNIKINEEVVFPAVTPLPTEESGSPVAPAVTPGVSDPLVAKEIETVTTLPVAEPYDIWVEGLQTTFAKDKISVNWNITGNASGTWALQKSADGQTFLTIATETFNTEEADFFNANDAKPCTGTNYYRVVLFPGKEEVFSNISAVFVPIKGQPEFASFPNPVKETLVVVPSGAGGLVEISIFDTMGKRTCYEKGPSKPTTISVAHFPAGTYTLQVKSGGKKLLRKLEKV